MPDSVWIVCVDYGYEGLGEPFLAFDSEEEAKQYKQTGDQFVFATGTTIVRAQRCNFSRQCELPPTPTA